MKILNLLRKDVTQQELLNFYNASIIYDQLPSKINGLVFNYNNINVIIINNSLSNYKKKKAILHELAHIELNQLNQIDDLFYFKIDKYEDDADKYLKEIERNLKRERI